VVYFRGWDATCDVRHTYLWIESPYQASRSQRVKQQYVCVSQVEMSFTKLPKYALVRKEIWFRLYSSTGRFTELAAPDVSVNAESRLSKDLKASAAASELRLSRAAEKAEERARIHVSDVKAELSRASQLSADDLKVYTTASELRLSRAAEKADERARINVSEVKAGLSAERKDSELRLSAERKDSELRLSRASLISAEDLKAHTTASELRLSRAAEKADERARINVSEVKAGISAERKDSELRLSAERKDSELRLSRAAEKADERARVNVSEIKAEFSNFKRLLFGSVVSCVVSLAVQANSTGKNTRDAEPSGWVRWGRSWFEADGVREKE